MGHSSVTITFRIVLAGALGVVGMSTASAQPGGGPQQGQQQGPVYQRKANNWNNGWQNGDFGRKDRRFFQQQIPNVQSNWFTRPYPYHLDFYKMKYGGSYAPYFGNLYGPPQVVTAPPYFGPYYGGWGQGAGGFENGAPNGLNGMPMEQPGLPSEGAIIERPVETIIPSNQPSGSLNGEILPVPNP
ncbi:MAG: hypothetical protein WD468_09540 [Pirellulales bacterium]